MAKRRKAIVQRETKETKVSIKVNLDGCGKSSVKTGIGFLDHMLQLFSKHSLIDLKIKAQGDLWVDEHHTCEDIAIVLGLCIRKALGNKTGIERYGFLLPMDETLAEVVVDLGGRPFLVWNVEFKREKLGDFSTELFEDFFRALSDNLRANIHVKICYGRNEHHKAEAIFKSFARAIRFAISRDERIKTLIPSTKGKI